MMNSDYQQLLGTPLHEFDCVASTNQYLLDLPAKDVPSGTSCLANQQSAGKGRSDRTWNSPLGGIYLSILMKPSTPFKFWHQLSLVMACAGVRAISGDHPDLSPQLKWPNDILISGRKVAGILAQSVSGAEPRIVIGIGINVTTKPELLPARPLYPATVLNLESSYPASCKRLAIRIREQFFNLFLEWESDPGAILDMWVSMCGHVNHQLTLSIDGKLIDGQFVGITSTGALQLKSGKRIDEYLVGDVIDTKEIKPC